MTAVVEYVMVVDQVELQVTRPSECLGTIVTAVTTAVRDGWLDDSFDGSSRKCR